MNGLMKASVSPGSSHLEASVTWSPQMRVPSGAAAAGPDRATSSDTTASGSLMGASRMRRSYDGRASDTTPRAAARGRRVRYTGPAFEPSPKEHDMKAAIFHGPHQPLTIENIDIAKPIGREVLVRTVASGVCHSDLHFIEGLYPFAAPAVLGHEAAGIVDAVGPHVDEFKPGDHVIACLSVFCGHCEYCLTGRTHLCQSRPVRATTEPPKLSWKGAPVNQFANLSSYAEQMLVHDSGLVKVRDDMPLDRGALIGCGVTTGVGAVLNTARVEPGTTVVVYGAGGVGLAAIQGAVIAGARMIIAVDVSAAKLET